MREKLVLLTSMIESTTTWMPAWSKIACSGARNPGGFGNVSVFETASTSRCSTRAPSSAGKSTVTVIEPVVAVDTRRSCAAPAGTPCPGA